MIADKVGLIQLGLGKVGKELVRQISSQQAAGRLDHLQYIGLADSKGLYLRLQGWSPDALTSLLANKVAGRPLDLWGIGGVLYTADLSALPELVARLNMPVIVIDLAATEATFPLLAGCRQYGCDLVLANKAPLAVPYEDYMEIAPELPGRTMSSTGVAVDNINDLTEMQPYTRPGVKSKLGRVRHEATVGAGLPVISTLEDLLASGDQIESIVASVSGTLGYLCTGLDRGLSFSTALREAADRGYTEPDPRDDLSGLDAARKALILARRMEQRINLSDVAVESLVPLGLSKAEASLEQFWAGLADVDARIAQRQQAAVAEGKVLRYLAAVTPGGSRVGLQAVDKDSPAGRLRGTDSLFIWRTMRYRDNPLIVQGPGAGATVTAAGVLADVLKLV